MIEEQIALLIVALDRNTNALYSSTNNMQTPAELSFTDTVGGMETTAERGEPDANPIPETMANVNTDAVGRVDHAPIGITELDVNNNPWDARIHTGKKTKTVKGVWKLMKKPATYPDKAQWDAYVASVLLQFKATVIPAQPQVNSLVGRVLEGVEIPVTVAQGMEAEWLATHLHNQMLANQPVAQPVAQPAAQPAVTIPTPPATTLPTIDDVRAKMMEYSQTKGASAVIETIATFAPTLEQIDQSEYGNLIGAMMLRPDLATPTHPAQQ